MRIKMKPSERAKEILRGGVKFHAGSGMFFIEHPTDGEKHIADIRGWGFIQYLEEEEIDSMKIQDAIGFYIQNAINEKLKSDGIII